MPTIKLSPNAESYWIGAGEALEIPDSVIGAPALHNETDPTTGLQVNETEFEFGVAGSAVLTIGSVITVGAADYETLVTDDDHVPNKRFCDDSYADAAHHHDAAYAPLVHNHNATYAGIGHNHNATYAAIAHDHNSDYVALTGAQTVAGIKTLSDALVLTPVLIANLPTGQQGMLAYVSDDVGGPTPVHYDGTNWRRVYDNAIASTS